ncbi:MAG TPA: urease accessory protein UreF [Casimicrobiaceae bacterium]|nr:urease accessory protein UreF [Casimicrobiaceae bacterium]
MNKLVRLLQLASPALPVGAYSYSQGLEWAVESGVVRDAATAQRWIGDLLVHVHARGEAAVAWRLAEAAREVDWQRFGHWHAWFRASRETAELAAETRHMGGALARLLRELDIVDQAALGAIESNSPIALPGAFALAVRAFALDTGEALAAYLWSWAENQVLAAMKTIPLGQVAGQKILLALGDCIPGAVACAQAIPDEDVASFAPGLALASAHHETQYTRLFRS